MERSTFLKLLCDPALVEDYADYSGGDHSGEKPYGVSFPGAGEGFCGADNSGIFEESPVFYQQDYKELARGRAAVGPSRRTFFTAPRRWEHSPGEKG